MENAKSYSDTCKKIGLAMLLFYAFFTLSTFAVSVFASFYKYQVTPFKAEVVVNVLFAIAYFLSFSIPAFILRRMCKELPNCRPIYKKFRFNRWIFLAILAVVAVNFTLSLLNNLIVTSFLPSGSAALVGSSEITFGRPMSEIWMLFLVEIFATAIVPALCEEYLFRGAVLTNLLPFGKSTAIFASAFLFGLMHQSPMQMLYTVLMGVVIGCVYVKTKSIWACVLLHAANNFITVIEEFFPVLTGKPWIVVLIDLSVVIFGAVALVLVLLHKNKEPSIESEGSFGRVYDRGMEHEEMPLELPAGQRLKKFFAPTVIIFVAICLFNIAKALLSFFGVTF